MRRVDRSECRIRIANTFAVAWCILRQFCWPFIVRWRRWLCVDGALIRLRRWRWDIPDSYACDTMIITNYRTASHGSSARWNCGYKLRRCHAQRIRHKVCNRHWKATKWTINSGLRLCEEMDAKPFEDNSSNLGTSDVKEWFCLEFSMKELCLSSIDIYRYIFILFINRKAKHKFTNAKYTVHKRTRLQCPNFILNI